MSVFCQLPEFERNLKKLSKKYPSLVSDIEDIKPILQSSPTGIGKNFTIIKLFGDTKIVKVRIQCESLRSRTIRLIYSYQAGKFEFMFIEIYFKGDKANEDKERIKDYLNNIKK